MTAEQTSTVDEPGLLLWSHQLSEAGFLVPTGLAGLYGLSGHFESIIDGIELVVAGLDTAHDAEVIRFPPVMSRAAFEQTGYLRAFPDQAGSVHAFTGGDRDHAALLHTLDAGEDWSQGLAPTTTVLCSAVCQPLYSTVPSPLPSGGKRWNLSGYVFRHEVSVDPARLQCFRQSEYVFVGEAEGALEHRDLWIERARDLVHGLGLEAIVEVGNDPFFGRLGRMLAANQQEDKLKYEVFTTTGPSTTSHAVASANYHRDHFGRAFGLRTADGAVAHSTCVGFGVERIALALLWAYGLSPTTWPVKIREMLWPA